MFIEYLILFVGFVKVENTRYVMDKYTIFYNKDKEFFSCKYDQEDRGISISSRIFLSMNPFNEKDIIEFINKEFMVIIRKKKIKLLL